MNFQSKGKADGLTVTQGSSIFDQTSRKGKAGKKHNQSIDSVYSSNISVMERQKNLKSNQSQLSYQSKPSFSVSRLFSDKNYGIKNFENEIQINNLNRNRNILKTTATSAFPPISEQGSNDDRMNMTTSNLKDALINNGCRLDGIDISTIDLLVKFN